MLSSTKKTNDDEKTPFEKLISSPITTTTDASIISSESIVRMNNDNFQDVSRPLDNHIRCPYDSCSQRIPRYPYTTIIDAINDQIKTFIDRELYKIHGNKLSRLKFIATLIGAGKQTNWRLEQKSVFQEIIPTSQLFKLIILSPNNNHTNYHIESSKTTKTKYTAASNDYHVTYEDEKKGMPTWLFTKYYRSVEYETMYAEKNWTKGGVLKNVSQKQLEFKEQEWKKKLLSQKNGNDDIEKLISQQWMFFHVKHMDFIWNDVSGNLSFNVNIEVSPKWTKQPYQPNTTTLAKIPIKVGDEKDMLPDANDDDIHPSVLIYHDIDVPLRENGTNEKSLDLKNYELDLYDIYFKDYFSLLPREEQLKPVHQQPFPALYKSIYKNSSNAIGLKFIPQPSDPSSSDFMWVLWYYNEKGVRKKQVGTGSVVKIQLDGGYSGFDTQRSLKFHFYHITEKKMAYPTFQMEIILNPLVNYCFHMAESMDTVKYFPIKRKVPGDDKYKGNTESDNMFLLTSPTDTKHDIYQNYIVGKHSISMLRILPRLHRFYEDVGAWETNFMLFHPNYAIPRDPVPEESNINDVFPFQTENGSMQWRKCISNPLSIRLAISKLEYFQRIISALSTTKFLWKDQDPTLYAILYYKGSSSDSDDMKEEAEQLQKDTYYLATQWNDIEHPRYMIELEKLEQALKHDKRFGTSYHIQVYYWFREIREKFRTNIKHHLLRKHLILTYFTFMESSEFDKDKKYIYGHYEAPSVSDQMILDDDDAMKKSLEKVYDWRETDVSDDLRTHGTTHFLHWTRRTNQSNRASKKYNTDNDSRWKYKGVYTMNPENASFETPDSVVDFITKKILDANGVNSIMDPEDLYESGHLEYRSSSVQKSESTQYSQILELLYCIPEYHKIQDKISGAMQHMEWITYKVSDDLKSISSVSESDEIYNSFSISKSQYNAITSLSRIIRDKSDFNYIHATFCTKHRDDKRQAQNTSYIFYKPFFNHIVGATTTTRIIDSRDDRSNPDRIRTRINNVFSDIITTDSRIFDTFGKDIFQRSIDECVYVFFILKLPLGDEVYGSEGLYFWKFLDFLPCIKITTK